MALNSMRIARYLLMSKWLRPDTTENDLCDVALVVQEAIEQPEPERLPVCRFGPGGDYKRGWPQE